MKKMTMVFLSLVLVLSMASVALGAAILPQDHGYDIENLRECSTTVTIDAYNKEDNTLTMTVWAQDLFDLVDVMEMKPGDTITIAGVEIAVDTVEPGEDGININGGLESGNDNGVTLIGFEGGTYSVLEYDDYPISTKIGTVTVPVPEDLVFVDSSDLEADEAKKLTAAELIEKIQSTTDEDGNNALSRMNTSATFDKDGKLIEVEYYYTPWN